MHSLCTHITSTSAPHLLKICCLLALPCSMDSTCCSLAAASSCSYRFQRPWRSTASSSNFAAQACPRHSMLAPTCTAPAPSAPATQFHKQPPTNKLTCRPCRCRLCTHSNGMPLGISGTFNFMFVFQRRNIQPCIHAHSQPARHTPVAAHTPP